MTRSHIISLLSSWLNLSLCFVFLYFWLGCVIPKSSHYAFHFPTPPQHIPSLGKSCPRIPFLFALRSTQQPHQATPLPSPFKHSFQHNPIAQNTYLCHEASYPEWVPRRRKELWWWCRWSGGNGVYSVWVSLLSRWWWWVGAHIMKCPLQFSKNTESPRWFLLFLSLSLSLSLSGRLRSESLTHHHDYHHQGVLVSIPDKKPVVQKNPDSIANWMA